MSNDYERSVTVELKREDDYKNIQAILAHHHLRPVDECWEQWISGERRRITFRFRTVEDGDFAMVALADFLPSR